MSEFLSTKRKITAVIAASTGFLALTGCDSSDKSWEVGVICPDKTEVQVASLNTEPLVFGTNDAKIEVSCVGAANAASLPTGLELTKGSGSVIENNKDYSGTIVINFHDPADGINPEISLNASLGTIYMDNVQIQSVAVK